MVEVTTQELQGEMTLHAGKLTNLLPGKLASVIACTVALWGGISSATQAADAIDFKKQIRPIFKERCYDCHGPRKQESGLRLDKRQEAMAGGDTGLAIVPGDTSSGLLLKYVQSEDAEVVMPAKGDRLTRKQIELLKKWIEEGAKWPE
jgi:mono/diheme cytochrome c family protein